MVKAKKVRLPASVAGAADRLYSLREEQSVLRRQMAVLDDEESKLRDFIINTLPKSQASGITGRVAHAEIRSKVIPQVKSWPLFYAYVLKTKDFSLMQRRLNVASVEERWEVKKVVPGVGKFTAVTVSITKK